MAEPNIKAITPEQMRDVLRAYVNKKGGLTAAAHALSTDKGHLSLILSGKRTVGDAIAAQLGFEKVEQTVRHKAVYYLGAV